MDETIIRNWNGVIGPDDDVYHLGDVCFMRPDAARALLSRLNGRIHLLRGNHDKGQFLAECSGRFEWVKEYHELHVGKQMIVLGHYPFVTWNKSHHGSWNLHGHCHGTLPVDVSSLRLDVGVDCHRYGPISFDAVGELMSKRTFKPIDHHGAR